MSNFGAVRFRDENGVVYGIERVGNQPRVSSMPYLFDIAGGHVAGHAPWLKLGYNPALTAEEDIWGAGGIYAFPTAETPMAVIGAATDDGSPATYSGTATGGTATTLIDTGKNFTTGEIVNVGDCVLLEKAGTTPEWGYVTAVAATELTLGRRFSRGGNPNGRTYDVVDRTLSAGAQVVKVEYLNAAYEEKVEFVILNGATEVNLTGQPFRINSFRVIAVGSSGTSAAGGITLKARTPTATIYSYITGLFTRSRNSVYTVPIGKTLFVTQFTAAYGTSGNQDKEYARIYSKANVEAATGFITGHLFYPFTEVMVQNSTTGVTLDVPARFAERTDMKVSATATAAGAITTVLRGWTE